MNNFDDILNNTPTEGQQNGRLSKDEYAAMKKTERGNLFALSDKTAMEVAGGGSKFQQFLDVQSTFSRYSAVNTLLILAQKPQASRLGDFEYWKDKGGFVKPGQTAISILEPHEYTKEDGSLGTGYNIKKVFDISQVDTRKVKTTPPPSYTERQLLAALISKAPMKISGVDKLPDGAGARTDPKTGELFVLKGMEFHDTFRSVAYELACAETKDCSNFDPQFTAYCASYILCKKYGVNTKDFDLGGAPAMFTDMKPQAIKAELSKIRDAADNIAGRMSKHLDAVQKAAKNQEAR